MTNRAYSALTVKAVDEEMRVFRGWATTPEVDRVQDTIDPMGARFKNPLVLLHQHNHDEPIGTVQFSAPNANGIEFEARIPVVSEPGPLKDRVDTAWGELKHGLVRAVSIGFRPIKYAYNDEGGIEFQEVEIFELSVVSVPANAGAVITGLKSLDADAIALIKQHDIGAPCADNPIPTEPDPAATGIKGRVVRLDTPARDRASKPFVIRSIRRIPS